MTFTVEYMTDWFINKETFEADSIEDAIKIISNKFGYPINSLEEIDDYNEENETTISKIRRVLGNKKVIYKAE